MSRQAKAIENAIAQAGICGTDARRLLTALDERGFVVMPREPTAKLLNASHTAMKMFEHAINAEWTTRFDRQRVKHLLRYRAMVERQRTMLGLAAEASDWIDRARVSAFSTGTPYKPMPHCTNGTPAPHDAADHAETRAAARVSEDDPPP